MLLTSEQRRAAQHRGHVWLEACPGSGKTRTVVSRIVASLEDVRGTPRRIACITYTNVAADEILDRVGSRGRQGDVEYCDISTIHSFCLEHVLRFYHRLVPEYARGYKVLSPDSDEFKQVASDVTTRHGLSARAREGFERLGRRIDGSPIVGDSGITAQAAIDFWKQLVGRGYIDFTSIVYYTYCVLRDHLYVSRYLACAYSHVIVDEFQDTSAIQVEILWLIARHERTVFFVVGDPEQSIFSFAGADRRLMPMFAGRLKLQRPHTLSANYRSSRAVLSDADSLISRGRPMLAAAPPTFSSATTFRASGARTTNLILDYFIPAVDANGIAYGRTAILASSYQQLYPVSRVLRDRSFPVHGPGARPYKASGVFARLGEAVGAAVESHEPLLVNSVIREVFRLAADLSGTPDLRLFGYHGVRISYRLVRELRAMRTGHEGVGIWLPMAARRITSILVDERVIAATDANTITQSASDMLAQMRASKVDIDNYHVSELGFYAQPEKAIRLMTIHKAKGLEFDAVAIIGLEDGVLPFFRSTKPDEVAEERRKLYVAITRARALLMYISGDDRGNMPCPFLASVNAVSLT